MLTSQLDAFKPEQKINAQCNRILNAKRGATEARSYLPFLAVQRSSSSFRNYPRSREVLRNQGVKLS